MARSPIRQSHEVVLDAPDLLAQFPEGSLTPALIQRAAAMGLVEGTEDGRFRVPDQRFLETGAALIRLGVPADVVLDEWALLSEVTDGVAQRFIALFEHHLLPADWPQQLEGERAADLAAALAQLRHTAGQVLAAALDASLAREGADRLATRLGPTM